MGEPAFIIRDSVTVIASEITEYNPITAALNDLRTKYAGVAYDVSTTKGLKEATQARAEIRGYRVALEAKRKEIKAPALERCKAIDSVAKEITAQLLDLEEPIDQQIKAEEKRKEEERAKKAMEESQKRAAIMMEIQRIQGLSKNITGKSSSEILELAQQVNAMELDREFFGFDFFDIAQDAKTSAFGHLMAAHSTVRAQEEEQARIAAERADLERLRKEQEAQQAEIAKLKAEAEAAQRAEQERLRKEREAEEARLKAEREAEAARLAVERKAEEDRLAEIRKQQKEEARKQAEVSRKQAEEQSRIEAEKAKIEDEKKRQAEEAKRIKEFKAKLKAAKVSDPVQALVRIWRLCEEATDPAEALREIAIIAQANIPDETA